METSTTIDDFGNSAAGQLSAIGSEKKIVNRPLIPIGTGGFNEGCKVEACGKDNAANSPHFTFCFNSLVESFTCPVMKTLHVSSAAQNCMQEKSSKKMM